MSTTRLHVLRSPVGERAVHARSPNRQQDQHQHRPHPSHAAQLQVRPDGQERSAAGGHEGVPIRSRRLLRRQGSGKGGQSLRFVRLIHSLFEYTIKTSL
ncbi:unnamed protein product [Ectocarpus sp. 4 AP-2014]